MTRIQLPKPYFKGEILLQEAIKKRRSKRNFKRKPLTLNQLSQLLWAGQGITGQKWGIKLRSVPSAGALYPLEIYVVVGRVTNLKAGVYRYLPKAHCLEKISEGDKRKELTEAAFGQPAVGRAQVTLVICAVFERTTAKYGERGKRYVLVEAGHAAQNICLESVSLGLATCPIGAFYDEKVSEILDLSISQKPLSLLPVGFV